MKRILSDEERIEHRAANMRRYYERHKEEIKVERLEYMRAWRAKNKEKLAINHKVWRDANKDKRAQYGKNYRAKDAEAKRAVRRQQYADNAEARREYYRKYHAENRETIQKSRALAYAKDPNRFLQRVKACDACKQSQDRYQKISRSMEKELGEFDLFVLQEARQLTRQRNELTGVKWHIDHIVPISKGGTHEHNNIQVVPATWNHKKHSKLIGTYFPRGEQ